MLPSGLINGEVYSTAYNKAFRARGIPQIIYTEFSAGRPDVSRLTPCCRQRSRYTLAGRRSARPRSSTRFRTLRRGRKRISWAPAFMPGATLGPHPETFWLGYAVGASAAWHPGSPDPHELTHSFYRLFYGAGAQRHGPALSIDEHAGTILDQQLG